MRSSRVLKVSPTRGKGDGASSLLALVCIAGSVDVLGVGVGEGSWEGSGVVIAALVSRSEEEEGGMRSCSTASNFRGVKHGEMSIPPKDLAKSPLVRAVDLETG